jgi:hypothetical protein
MRACGPGQTAAGATFGDQTLASMFSSEARRSVLAASRSRSGPSARPRRSQEKEGRPGRPHVEAIGAEAGNTPQQVGKRNPHAENDGTRRRTGEVAESIRLYIDGNQWRSSQARR